MLDFPVRYVNIYYRQTILLNFVDLAGTQQNRPLVFPCVALVLIHAPVIRTVLLESILILRFYK